MALPARPLPSVYWVVTAYGNASEPLLPATSSTVREGAVSLGVPVSDPLIRVCHLPAPAGSVDRAAAKDAASGTSTRKTARHD